MRILLIVIWLLVPVGAVAFHYGPGQDFARRDLAAGQLQRADAARAEKDWKAARSALEASLESLPADDVKSRRSIQLELCKVMMMDGGLPTARQDLETLLAELTADPEADPVLVVDCRESLASAQYYMTWLMRLEGLDDEVWLPEINAAQQNYRLLATSTSSGDGLNSEELAQRTKENLEAAVRLARMDLGELQGLPLPSQ